MLHQALDLSSYTKRQCLDNTMHLDQALAGNIFFGQEPFDLLALITLQLNDASEFLVFHDTSVTAELLLKRLRQLVQVKFLIQALNGG